MPDLVRPGDWIRCLSYGYEDDGFLVISVTRHAGLPGLECVYYVIAGLKRRILAMPRKPSREDIYTNHSDVVAQGGRLCGLFEADKSVYAVSPPPEGVKIPAWVWRMLDAQRQLRLF